MVSMGAIGVDRGMRDDTQKRSRAGTLKLAFEPCQLFCLLFRGEGEIAAVAFLGPGVRHVAIKRQESNQWVFSGKYKAIPARGHCPAGRGAAVASAARVLQLSIHFALRPLMIIGVS